MPLINFPEIEPRHVWLMAVMAVTAAGETSAETAAKRADDLVQQYKQRFGFARAAEGQAKIDSALED